MLTSLSALYFLLSSLVLQPTRVSSFYSSFYVSVPIIFLPSAYFFLSLQILFPVFSLLPSLNPYVLPPLLTLFSLLYFLIIYFQPLFSFFFFLLLILLFLFLFLSADSLSCFLISSIFLFTVCHQILVTPFFKSPCSLLRDFAPRSHPSHSPSFSVTSYLLGIITVTGSAFYMEIRSAKFSGWMMEMNRGSRCWVAVRDAPGAFWGRRVAVMERRGEEESFYKAFRHSKTSS